MRRSLAIILASTAILAFACDGVSSEPKPPTAAATRTPVSDEAFKIAAEASARSIQITQADLPSGWSGGPHKPNDTKLDLSPTCAFFNEIDPWRSALVNVYADDFKDSARKLNSEAVVYRTAELAEADSSLAISTVTECAQEIGRAIEANIVQDAPGATAHVVFSVLDPVELDGWTAGYKASIAASSASGEKTVTAFFTWAWKVNGRMAVALEFGSSEATPDLSMAKALKSLLAKRLADADATLPN